MLQLGQMGFLDFKKNEAIIDKHKNNFEAAIDEIMFS